MDEARVSRIIELEGSAVQPERIASSIRWHTAQLYWEEVSSGTSQGALAERVRRSAAHVGYMVRAWKSIKSQYRHEGDYLSLPDFQSVYNSPEVRGPAAQEKQDRQQDRDADKGRETLYKGITMRSRLEADFAQALDRRGFPWKYEPCCFAGDGGQWLPDFYVEHPQFGPLYVELKPASFDATGIAEQLRRIAVTWDTDEDATVQLVLWQFRIGPALIITSSGEGWSAA